MPAAPMIAAPGRRGRGSTAHPVWIGLLLLLVAIEGGLMLADRGLVGSVRWRALAYQNGAFWVGLLFGWAPNYPAQPATMFVTYAFLHSSLGHLLGNSAALAWLGQTLGGRCGPQPSDLSRSIADTSSGSFIVSPRRPSVRGSVSVVRWVIQTSLSDQREGQILTSPGGQFVVAPDSSLRRFWQA